MVDTVINDGGAIALKALAEANRLAQLNIPYRWGGNNESGFDCSGFVQWCYSVGGYPISKDRRVWTTTSLHLLGVAVSPGAQLPGDLIFPDAGHVGICVDKTRFIDAPETGKTVGVHDYTKYNHGSYAVRRLVFPYVGTDAAIAGALVGPNGVLTGIATPIIAAQQLWNAVTGVVNWLSDGTNWLRIGMVIGGAALVMFGIIQLENA